MRERPLVSAVMVNWNGAEHLRLALPSLTRQSYSPFEILVIDNGSTDHSKNVAAESDVTWIGLPRNIGLAPACNEGARRAQGEYIVFLNNDMRFAPDFIERLVAVFDADETVFATDARQLDWDGTKDVHLATRVRRRSLISSYVQPGLLPLIDIEQVPAVGPVMVAQACAAAMAVRKSMFDALEGFDERLPISWEDTEICWRAWLKGWSCVFVPDAVCWHRVGASVADSPAGAAARFRGTVGGRLLFACKHLPWFYILNSWLVSCLGVGKNVLAGRYREALSKAKIIAEFTRLVPEALADQRRLYRDANVSPRAHLKRMLAIT